MTVQNNTHSSTGTSTCVGFIFEDLTINKTVMTRARTRREQTATTATVVPATTAVDTPPSSSSSSTLGVVTAENNAIIDRSMHSQVFGLPVDTAATSLPSLSLLLISSATMSGLS